MLASSSKPKLLSKLPAAGVGVAVGALVAVGVAVGALVAVGVLVAVAGGVLVGALAARSVGVFVGVVDIGVCVAVDAAVGVSAELGEDPRVSSNWGRLAIVDASRDA